MTDDINDKGCPHNPTPWTGKLSVIPATFNPTRQYMHQVVEYVMEALKEEASDPEGGEFDRDGWSSYFLQEWENGFREEVDDAWREYCQIKWGQKTLEDVRASYR
jgi:hypothetical protein